MIELVLKKMLNSSLQEMESILRSLSLLVQGKQEQFATETMVILLNQGKK